MRNKRNDPFDGLFESIGCFWLVAAGLGVVSALGTIALVWVVIYVLLKNFG